ncbi:MAG TPA: 5'-methylthioadenosine/adenosylhomocysteine nucleosidase [Steroidobacteraceae bacterium]|jgi:adenosylhomocysteine nucleosidase|nr:5'-methylthioadenosine/adenosylhomocysteine nucleosidase [Steroidobacteraceae bacterium]
MLALISAMPEEISAVVESLTDVTTQEIGQRQFHAGVFHGRRRVVAVFSRIGKVAAAATVTQLITTYGATHVVFSGVAGAVQHGLAIGDIVVGTELIQHDLDATPIFPRYEVPLLGRTTFATDPQLRAQLSAAAEAFVRHDLGARVAAAQLRHFGIRAPRVLGGLIASGDKFFANAADLAELRQRLPAVACVEMEGAAVAQVCAEYGVRLGVVRTISDTADESAAHDFPRFAREIARHYSVGILSRFLIAL